MSELRIGSRFIWRTPGLILTGIVEKIYDDCVQATLEDPWGRPFPFSGNFAIADIGVCPENCDA